MKKRFLFLAFLLVFNVILSTPVQVSATVPVSPVNDKIRVAVCYNPQELNTLFPFDLEPFRAYMCGVLLGDVDLEPELVTYSEIADGALIDDGGRRVYDVAYFYGGYMILIGRPPGFDAALKEFARLGGGVIGHCGAAAAFSEGLKVLFFTLPGIGLLPIITETSLLQLLNLVARTLQTGIIDLAPVTIEFPPSNCMGFEGGLYTFAWDGGLAFPRVPGGEVVVCASVTEFPVSRLINMQMRGRAFFVTGSFEGKGKVVLSPGSPELLLSDPSLAIKILRAEIETVLPPPLPP